MEINHALIPYQEALSRLLKRVPAPVPERCDLGLAKGRVLADVIRADMDLPPFRKSFMDGFAVRSVDLAAVPCELEIVGELTAGGTGDLQIGAGQCAAIMTGAPVPAGADAVQQVEKTEPAGPALVRILEEVRPGQHVAEQASEVQAGDVVLEPGRVLGPAEVGVLASFGYTSVPVYRAPRAAIYATGDELVAIDRDPGPGQIRNSNVYMLQAQCEQLGMVAEIRPVVADEPEATRKAVTEARSYDVAIFSGGVSMGSRDYVHQVLIEAQLEVFFHKVAIKPGKPILCGRFQDQLFFGLPGNPVSSLVTFELFVRPAVRQWMGYRQPVAPVLRGRLETAYENRPGRLFLKPAQVEIESGGYKVWPLLTRGSADLVAFSRANALILVPADSRGAQAGASVEFVRLEGE